MSEPWNSVALVVVGAAAGAWVVWVSLHVAYEHRRQVWRRYWRALAERQAADFTEARTGGSAARFLAESSRRRMEQRARRLKEVAK